MPKTPDAPRTISQVERLYATDQIVSTWRSDDEEQKFYATLEDQSFLSTARNVSLISLMFGSFLALATPAAAWLDQASSSAAIKTACGGAALAALGLGFYIFATVQDQRAGHDICALRPFESTPAACWAYRSALTDEPSRDQAEALRTALDGKKASEQSGMPEHDDLLRLGLTAVRN